MADFLRKGLRIGLLGVVVAVGSLAGVKGCGIDFTEPDYTATESLTSKIKTLGVGYRYEFRKGDEGELIYTVEPNYKGMLGKFMMADNFYIKDNKGNLVNIVDGDVWTISSNHRILNSEGKVEETISMKFGSGLLDRASRMLFSRGGFYIKDKNEKEILDIQETWASVLSPWLREYAITNPETGDEIGLIKSKFSLGGLFGAMTYKILLKEDTSENRKNLAIAIRVIDAIEDYEDSQSDDSSSDDSDE